MRESKSEQGKVKTAATQSRERHIASMSIRIGGWLQ